MLNSLRNNWNALSNLQKAGLVAILVAVFGGILALAITSSRPSYKVLYTKLNLEDASAIKEKLQGLSVNFKIENGGETIQVPSDQVDDLRLSLASENLPKHGKPGWELMDKTSIGATTKQQSILERRAIEGELTRTIKSLDGVEEAQITLALPEKPLFSETTDDVKASVTLHLKDGYRLSEKQVAGIVHLVSSSVERLRPENVTVHDSKGALLSNTGEGDNIDKDQIEMQERFERRLTQELQRLADRTLGNNRAEISVRTELDWDQSQLSSESYKPSGTNGANLPTNETKTKENYTRPDGAPPITAPGVLNSSVAGSNAGGTPLNYNKDQNTNTYAVDKKVERRVMAQGKIKHLSVAVFLDEAANIPPAKQIDLRNTLAAAAGLDTTSVAAGGRGDQISLTVLAFDRSEEKKAEADAAAAVKEETRLTLIRNGAALLTLILVAVFTMIMMRPRRTKRQKLDATSGERVSPSLPGGAKPTGIEGNAAVSADGTLLESGGSPDEIPLDEDELASPLGRIRRIAITQPEDVAAMLQEWLRDQPTITHR